MEERMLARSSENISKVLSLMIAHENNIRNYSRRNNYGIELVFNEIDVSLNSLSGITNLFNSLSQTTRPERAERSTSERAVSDVSSNITYKPFCELVIQNEIICPITQEQFHSDDIVALLECGHYFKKDAFLSWSVRSRSCPSCRAQFR
jgi:hypothetical protein